MERVLVTGAAGFLGRHICRHFRDSGFAVTGLDQTEFIEPGIRTLVGDLTAAEQVLNAAAGHDVIAHIGAIGDVYLAGERPTLAAHVNVVGTSNVAESALETGARVIYASTWEVYGEPDYEPLDESHPTRPDHPYSITKLAGESLLLAACHLRGLSAVALRLGTAYGSGIRRNSVFRIFLDRARAGEPITIQGSGLQGRQFTHASDIARAFQLAAVSDRSGEAYNVVAPEIVTIKELAELLVERHPTELTFGPARSGDVPSALVSADRALEHLGWKAEVPFESGLEEFVTGVLTDGS